MSGASKSKWIRQFGGGTAELQLIENDDPLSGFDEFGSGDQSGKPGPDNNRIGVVRHPSPPRSAILGRNLGGAKPQLTPNAL